MNLQCQLFGAWWRFVLGVEYYVGNDRECFCPTWNGSTHIDTLRPMEGHSTEQFSMNNIYREHCNKDDGKKASDQSIQLFWVFQCHFPIYVQHSKTLGRCFWGSKFNDCSIINSRDINEKIFEDICETDFNPSSHSRGIVFIYDRLTSGQNFKSVDSAYDWIIYFS